MALSSLAPAQLGAGVSKKLTKDNYLLWKAQFLPAVRGAQLMGYLEGNILEPPATMEVVKADAKKEIVPNLEHASWVAKD